ncbi:MAG: hypothetical protein Q9185_006349 [Variospora sp. 1 TL-2023]
MSAEQSRTDYWQTRTIQGSNARTEYAATVTAGTSTITVTSSTLPAPTYPYLNTSEPSVNSTSFTTVSSTSTRYNTIYVTGTTLPYPLNTTSLLPLYPTSNATSTTSSSTPSSTTSTALLPIGQSIDPRGCPDAINATIFTAATGQQYQLQCYVRYGGPVSIGLDFTTLRECIEACSTVNAGFSAIRCYGVTWLKYTQGALRCNLKAQSALLAGGSYDETAASAVLLTGVPPPVAGQFKTGKGEVEEEVVGSGAAGSLADSDPGTWRVGRVGRRG